MTNNSIFDMLWSMISQVLQLATDIKVYDDNGISVSVLQFFIALSIMFIVLSALLNFIRVQSVNNVGHVTESVGLIRRTMGELKGRDSNGVMAWMFE